MDKLKSANSLIESADFPILVRGGPSSSDVLNRIHTGIAEDLVRLNARTQRQHRRQQILTLMLEQQAVGIQGLVASLQAMATSSPSGRGVATFFGPEFVAAGSSAYLDEDYGQVTLPRLSVSEKMFSTDVDGSVWVPEDSRLRFIAKSSYSPGTIPGDDEFDSSIEDRWGIDGRPDAFFLGGQVPSNSYVFLKAELPQTLSAHRLANVVYVHPFPAFSHSLVGAFYRTTGGAWNAIDFSYLPQYNEGTNTAGFLGPFKLHFGPAEVSQVLVVMKASNWWGVHRMGVQLAEYAPTSELQVDLSSYNPGYLKSAVLRGMDPGVLNQYPKTLDSDTVTVSMSQTRLHTTPVITAVDARWDP